MTPRELQKSNRFPSLQDITFLREYLHKAGGRKDASFPEKSNPEFETALDGCWKDI